MAGELAFRTVDHADRTLELRLAQPCGALRSERSRRPRAEPGVAGGVTIAAHSFCGKAGRTFLICIGPSQSDAAATVPLLVPKPTR